MAAVGKHVLYAGRVQGVGFRYTAARLAGRHGVAGIVRNLPTGEVELRVEDEPERVEAYLAALAEYFRANITTATVRDEPPRGLTDFRILP
jgi:acylphosphatase